MNPAIPMASLIWSAVRHGVLTAELGQREEALQVAEALARAGHYPGLPDEIAAVARAGARKIKGFFLEGPEPLHGGSAA